MTSSDYEDRIHSGSTCYRRHEDVFSTLVSVGTGAADGVGGVAEAAEAVAPPPNDERSRLEMGTPSACASLSTVTIEAIAPPRSISPSMPV
jgi:hypothetical protein